MGYATIIKHLGQSAYLARLEYATVSVADLKTWISDTEKKLIDVDEAIETETNVMEGIVDQISTTINSGLLPDKKNIALIDLTAQRQRQYIEIQRLKNDRARLKIQLHNLNKDLEKAEESTESEDQVSGREIWCADYSPELAGRVETIEICGEDAHVLIAPGGENELINRTENRTLMPMSAMSNEQSAANLVLFNAWQKHAPTYRTGIITELDTNQDPWQPTIALDDKNSGVRSLDDGSDININPDEETQAGVRWSWRYMDCDHLAFAQGDHVVCEFPDRDWESGVIVGFVDEPRPCETEPVFVLLLLDGDVGTASVWNPKQNAVVVEPCTVQKPLWVSEVDAEGNVTTVPNPVNDGPWNDWLMTIVFDGYSRLYSAGHPGITGDFSGTGYWDHPVTDVAIADEVPEPETPWVCNSDAPASDYCISDYHETVESVHCDGGQSYYKAYSNCGFETPLGQHGDEGELDQEACYHWEFSSPLFWKWLNPWSSYTEGSDQHNQRPEAANALPTRDRRWTSKKYIDESICHATENSGELEFYGFANDGESETEYAASWTYTFRTLGGQEWSGSAVWTVDRTCISDCDAPDLAAAHLYGGFLAPRTE